MRSIFVVCLLVLLGVSPMTQGQDDGLSHRMVPDLPRYCGRVVGPTGQGIWRARLLFEYEGNSKVLFTGLLGEFCLVIPEIPDVLEIRVEKDGFETSEWKYPAKEKGDNYLTLRMLPKDKVLNEMTVSADKIQVKLGEKTLEYQHPYKSLRGCFEQFFDFDLPAFGSDSRVRGKTIHYGNIDINKEGWDEEELAHERIAMEEARSRKILAGFGKVQNNDVSGYALQVDDYLGRGCIPYAHVLLIDGKDTVRLTCDALGSCFWKTSKVINKFKFIVMAEGYQTSVREYWANEGPRNCFILPLWPKHFRGLTRAIILEDKIQIIQGDTVTYPLKEGAFKPFEEDFAGNLLRGLPGVSMENDLLTVNGQPIHCVDVIRKSFFVWKNMIENCVRAGKKD